ncbi:hypothetical protein P153DRAFT_363386 [Dothidotthia symphoricarpi CBS 119687]|uniref:Uncharacterized protein n=1 Tax=Dothidotthia symphoricarpi CBS 119687 TaxID=1392245 RepID=A0A6A6AQ74_9PLEO|nr:uncharacterized protein P153DRAFT_363386 [Dothidotthia symphoricarpi CBS 119687]KAF2133165.1 hypothetical protein P153DRAFT_363386 [Dothidotthia symphoricarpi CBS 119687]
MPRNGDGSSDNGPIEGQNIVHGSSGDTTLKHTQKVAPMPEIEKGDAIEGLGAGGAASQTATGEQVVEDEKKESK